MRLVMLHDFCIPGGCHLSICVLWASMTWHCYAHVQYMYSFQPIHQRRCLSASILGHHMLCMGFDQTRAVRQCIESARQGRTWSNEWQAYFPPNSVATYADSSTIGGVMPIDDGYLFQSMCGSLCYMRMPHALHAAVVCLKSCDAAFPLLHPSCRKLVGMTCAPQHRLACPSIYLPPFLRRSCFAQAAAGILFGDLPWRDSGGLVHCYDVLPGGCAPRRILHPSSAGKASDLCLAPVDRKQREH